MRLFGSFVWALVGGLLGNITAGPYNTMLDNTKTLVCNADEHMLAAEERRREALRLTVSIEYGKLIWAEVQGTVSLLHRLANEEFEKAKACGSTRAVAQLGVAYCQGWALRQDREKGMTMLREAARKDIAFHIDWQRNKFYC